MIPNLFSLPFTEDVEGCSRAGAEKALPKAGTQMAMVYAALQAGPKTDQELVQETGLALNIVNARRWALVKDGLVESAGTIKASTGVNNTRWRISEH